ncbi:uncharacterized protein LOC122243546 [Penaeus japonicus]|uniref:uncharacterized protein LOC122243546 n=1 Tax=Penaeus japonicus TaxID=27405 RepID=UPI001C710461|nr:uncharacterized protein LOC122243546 [Penaeus japonicus]
MAAGRERLLESEQTNELPPTGSTHHRHWAVVEAIHLVADLMEDVEPKGIPPPHPTPPPPSPSKHSLKEYQVSQFKTAEGGRVTNVVVSVSAGQRGGRDGVFIVA